MNRIFYIVLLCSVFFVAAGCRKVPLPVVSPATPSSLEPDGQSSTASSLEPAHLIKNVSGNNLQTRFEPPQGFTRVEKEGFALYLSELELKTDGSFPVSIDNLTQSQLAAEAVFVWDNLNKDERNSNTFIRMYLEYLFSQEKYADITIHFVSGFNFEFSKWMEGNRIKVNGSTVKWEKTAPADSSEESFQRYLKNLFAYVNTKSLDKDLKAAETPQIGDVYTSNGGMMIVDMAQKDDQIVVILAKGNNPATEPYIIKNDTELSPWFAVSEGGMLYVAGDTLKFSDAKRFVGIE